MFLETSCCEIFDEASVKNCRNHNLFYLFEIQKCVTAIINYYYAISAFHSIIAK